MNQLILSIKHTAHRRVKGTQVSPFRPIETLLELKHLLYIAEKAATMTEQNEFQQFFTGTSIQPQRLFVEEPPPPPPPIEQAHSGFAPMDRIALEGQAYRGLASGGQPWWILISGWIIFGLPCLAVGISAVVLGEWGMLVAIAPITIMLWILWRGTQAKLAAQKEQIQRRAKYKRENF